MREEAGTSIQGNFRLTHGLNSDIISISSFWFGESLGKVYQSSRVSFALLRMALFLFFGHKSNKTAVLRECRLFIYIKTKERKEKDDFQSCSIGLLRFSLQHGPNAA